jgi:lysophospholipase L1-like esterase
VEPSALSVGTSEKRLARRALTRLAILGGGFAGALFMLELAVRVALSLDANYFEEALAKRRSTDGRELTLVDIVRPHPDDRVVFALRPGTRGRFVGHDLAINSIGMRDVERSYAKPPGAFRIVALGDSHTFGWGVAREETYPAVLEQMLRERFPDGEFEVWNLGVPGYNTVQEVRALELAIDRIEPDVVIVNYVDNDMDLPNFLALRPNLLSPKRSYLAELVERRSRILRDEEILPPTLVGVEVDPRTRRYVMDPERIPERYRPLAGWDNMEAAFLHLLDLARRRGIRAVLLFNPDDYRNVLRGRTDDARRKGVRELAERCADAGYLVLDPQEHILAYLRQNGLEASSLWIRATDSHTNPLRHRLLAEVLLDGLSAAGILAPRGSDRS